MVCHVHKAVTVKVDVSEGAEQSLEEELVGSLTLGRTSGASSLGGHGQTLEGVDEEVLQLCRLCRLAAHTHGGAACPLLGLLTLVAEHVWWCVCLLCVVLAS